MTEARPSDVTSRGFEEQIDKSPSVSQKSALIFLIGYRGTGKSVVAAHLADRLGWNWIDADDALEKKYRLTIREIFAQAGEEAFREKESAILVELCRLRQYIVATGGGVILRLANRKCLREWGKVVWLTADPQTLWQRIQNDPSTLQRRPALTVGGLGEIENVLRTREPLYRDCADLTISTLDRSPKEVADLILARWHLA